MVLSIRFDLLIKKVNLCHPGLRRRDWLACYLNYPGCCKHESCISDNFPFYFSNYYFVFIDLSVTGSPSSRRGYLETGWLKLIDLSLLSSNICVESVYQDSLGEGFTTSASLKPAFSLVYCVWGPNLGLTTIDCLRH